MKVVHWNVGNHKCCDESSTDTSNYLAFDYYRKERFNTRLSLFFFFKDVITHTLCKRKRIGRRQIKVSWVSLLLDWGAWGDTGNTFLFFRLQKMEHWKNKKKNGKKVQQKVCISTKLQHTSRTAAQDVISAVSWIRGRENWYWCRMKLFQSPSDYDTLSQLQTNRRRVGMRVGRNQTENPKEFVCMDLSATGRRLVRLGCSLQTLLVLCMCFWFKWPNNNN